MKLLKLLSTAVVGLLAIAPFSLNAQQVQAATVKAVKVTGTATIDKTALKGGEVFAQGKTIVTGPDSRVLLRFSNGAAMSIRENSSIKLTTFTQEPITAVKVATHEQIKSEPSKSNTQTTLNYGKVLARAHQMAAKGSKFEVNTPTGAAGIRGSIALITFDAASGRLVIASLQGTIEGLVTGQNQTITIRENTQIEVNAVRDSQGNITSVSINVDRPLTDPDIIQLLKDIGVQMFSLPDNTIVSPSDLNLPNPNPDPNPNL